MKMEMNKNLNLKLLAFQKNVETIKKDGKNSFFKKPDGSPSSYATLPNILGEVKPMLTELGILLLQPIKDGAVYSILIDTDSGEFMESYAALPVGLNAQQIGSAITYYRRYTLTSALCLDIDDDDDGNAASANTAQQKTTTGNNTVAKKDDDGRPWLSEAQFKKALVRAKDGDPEFIEKLFKEFKMKKEYKAEINKAAGL